VLDRIRHGTAQEILSRASAACQFESPHTAVSDHQWREYFGLPVMSLSAAANYYGLNVSEIEHHIRKKITYAGGVAHLWYAPKIESTNKTYDLSRLSVHQDK
jgi:hypothetical protein